MIIFCDGVFDLFHEGHINHFKSIKTYFKNCKLIVGVMKDKDVIEYKREPHHSESIRCELVKSCKYVDEVLIFNQADPYELIKQVKPDIIVKGGDYTPNEVIGSDIAKVKIFNYIDGYSTTKILEKK